MIVGLTIVFIVFASLSVKTLRSSSSVKHRNSREWAIDSIGLLVQGLVVPIIQTLLLGKLWVWLMPSLKGAVQFPPVVAFLVSFVFVDYLYYWNHRLLHIPQLWNWHRVHHSTKKLDLLASSRNSLLTPALIVYVWVNSLVVFALGDATYFVVASSIGAALDLWRHSGLVMATGSKLHAVLSPWLILPQDHEWHHARSQSEVNFGANLNLWDRLHGTYLRNDARPDAFGTSDVEELTWREFFVPSKGRQS